MRTPVLEPLRDIFRKHLATMHCYSRKKLRRMLNSKVGRMLGGAVAWKIARWLCISPVVNRTVTILMLVGNDQLYHRTPSVDLSFLMHLHWTVVLEKNVPPEWSVDIPSSKKLTKEDLGFDLIPTREYNTTTLVTQLKDLWGLDIGNRCVRIVVVPLPGCSVSCVEAIKTSLDENFPDTNQRRDLFVLSEEARHRTCFMDSTFSLQYATDSVSLPLVAAAVRARQSTPENILVRSTSGFVGFVKARFDRAGIEVLHESCDKLPGEARTHGESRKIKRALEDLASSLRSTRPLSWFAIAHQKFVRRSIMKLLWQRLQTDDVELLLPNRGQGGTTVGRAVLHTVFRQNEGVSFCCAVLKNIAALDRPEAKKCLQDLVECTGKPLLLLVDHNKQLSDIRNALCGPMKNADVRILNLRSEQHQSTFTSGLNALSVVDADGLSLPGWSNAKDGLQRSELHQWKLLVAELEEHGHITPERRFIQPITVQRPAGGRSVRDVVLDLNSVIDIATDRVDWSQVTVQNRILLRRERRVKLQCYGLTVDDVESLFSAQQSDFLHWRKLCKASRGNRGAINEGRPPYNRAAFPPTENVEQPFFVLLDVLPEYCQKVKPYIEAAVELVSSHNEEKSLLDFCLFHCYFARAQRFVPWKIVASFVGGEVVPPRLKALLTTSTAGVCLSPPLASKLVQWSLGDNPNERLHRWTHKQFNIELHDYENVDMLGAREYVRAQIGKLKAIRIPETKELFVSTVLTALCGFELWFPNQLTRPSDWKYPAIGKFSFFIDSLRMEHDNEEVRTFLLYAETQLTGEMECKQCIQLRTHIARYLYKGMPLSAENLDEADKLLCKCDISDDMNESYVTFHQGLVRRKRLRLLLGGKRDSLPQVDEALSTMKSMAQDAGANGDNCMETLFRQAFPVFKECVYFFERSATLANCYTSYSCQELSRTVEFFFRKLKAYFDLQSTAASNCNDFDNWLYNETEMERIVGGPLRAEEYVKLALRFIYEGIIAQRGYRSLLMHYLHVQCLRSF